MAMASTNPNHQYQYPVGAYDTSMQFVTFPHPSANGPREFRHATSVGQNDSSFKKFASPPAHQKNSGNFQQRSTSVSSTGTTASRNFSRPVLVPASQNLENTSLPHIVDHQLKRNSITRKPVPPVDSAVVSPVHMPEQLAQWHPSPSKVAGVASPGSEHDRSISSPSHPTQHRFRKSSGTLAGMTVPYHPGSQTSTPPASDGGVSTASYYQNLSSPEAELQELEALTIHPRSTSLPQHAQVHFNPHRTMPEVAVYHVADQPQPQYGLGASNEYMGEPGPMIEEHMEQLPQPRYPNQYPQPYGSNYALDAQRSTDSISRPRSANTQGSSSSDGVRQTSGSHRAHLSVGGTPSPSMSPMMRPQTQSGKHSPEHRPQSYIDLLQTPYAQQVAPSPNLDNSFLRQIVGKNASLMQASKTLDAYRANVKNISDPAIQYEFAVFMIQTALDLAPDAQGPPTRADLIRDARVILQKLVDKSYPFAQYYLADGYASGLFNKGKEDYDRAFPLFVAAAKRGHAEAAYRAALCYELGWGCRKDYSKSVRFYEMSASKNHPGAATRLGLAWLNDLLGQTGKYREGYKWLKRAAESADAQYNAAPYELAKLHENGFGADIFKDEAYAAQLFTQSANLGHSDANLVMGKAYEHGYLGCPQDALLSIHYYTGAANAGEPEGMMALCAWYLFGAPPLLEKNDNEAYEWAKQAADCGYAKAEYSVGYFKEMGIGCKPDSMEANHWYWRAAQQGDERAKQRLKTIENAASGGGSLKKDDEHKTRKGLFGRLVK